MEGSECFRPIRGRPEERSARVLRAALEKAHEIVTKAQQCDGPCIDCESP